MAARAGVDPYTKLSPRELNWMAIAKDRTEWLHTSCLLAQLANTFKGKGRAAKPTDYMPGYLMEED